MQTLELIENKELDSLRNNKEDSAKFSDSTDLPKNENKSLNQPTAEESSPFDLLVSRIGLGKYHYLMYISLGVYFLCDGAEVIAISFLNVVLKDVWNLSDSQVGSIGTAIFGGYFLGSLVSGFFTEKYGRRRIYLLSTLFTFIVAIWSALAPTFTIMLIARGIFGFCQGVQTPLALTITAEITPNKVRGKVMVIISAIFTVGELIACGIVLVTLTAPSEGNWRGLLIWVSVPAGIAFLIALCFMLESPRYAIFKDLNQGLRVLNQMNKMNKKQNLDITADEKRKLQEWSIMQRSAVSKSVGIGALLNRMNRSISVKLWIMWFVLSFVYYGIIYVFPMVLQAESTNSTVTEEVGKVFVSVLGEIPSYVISYIIIERARFGRKNSLTLSYFFAGVACAFSFICTGGLFAGLIFIAKMAANTAFTMILPFTSEVYHTKYRTTGAGMASAMSRIGGVIMPWLTLQCFNFSPKMPFLVYGLACFIASLSAYLLPYDTCGRELDKLTVETEPAPKDQQALPPEFQNVQYA